MLKTALALVVRVALLAALCGCAAPLSQTKKVIFQASTIDALMTGVYDGVMTCGELKKHGDFGIGTFEGLDGEMVGLDGRVFQIRADGGVYAAPDATKTPFANVVFFQPDRAVMLAQPRSLQELEQFLDGLLPSQNLFYAVKIEGKFRRVKTRSVPRQTPPYPSLREVARKQTVFEFHQVAGTIVGFRSPGFVAGLNVPGYHLHFLTKDRAAGGHLLACDTEEVRIEIEAVPRFFLALPENQAFLQADLSQDRQKEVQQVEK
jgi:acetolactate decarboxylase